jgi:hypothetical protein
MLCCPFAVVYQPTGFGLLILNKGTISTQIRSLLGYKICVFLDELDTELEGSKLDIEIVMCQHNTPVKTETVIYGAKLLARKMPIRLQPMKTHRLDC